MLYSLVYKFHDDICFKRLCACYVRSTIEYEMELFICLSVVEMYCYYTDTIQNWRGSVDKEELDTTEIEKVGNIRQMQCVVCVSLYELLTDQGILIGFIIPIIPMKNRQTLIPAA